MTCLPEARNSRSAAARSRIAAKPELENPSVSSTMWLMRLSSLAALIACIRSRSWISGWDWPVARLITRSTGAEENCSTSRPSRSSTSAVSCCIGCTPGLAAMASSSTKARSRNSRKKALKTNCWVKVRTLQIPRKKPRIGPRLASDISGLHLTSGQHTQPG